MSFKKLPASGLVLLSIILLLLDVRAGGESLSTQPEAFQLKAPEIDHITAEELKSKLARNEPVAIIDVRASDSYIGSDNRIKGAVYVKLRRLKYRLGFPPLKNVPRDREVVTYCACPNDESALSAAQILLSAGFKRVRALKGGWHQWLKVNGQVEPRPKG